MGGQGGVPGETCFAVWLTAPSGTAADAVTRLCAELAQNKDATVFSQVTGGQGALILARVLPDRMGELWPERVGRFRLRAHERSLSGPAAARPSPYLLSVQLLVPDATRHEDIRRWLDEEHSGRQLAVAGANWYRGYESAEDDATYTFLNLWGLDSPEVIETPDWAQARDTPWRERLMEAFVHTERAVYRPTNQTTELV